MTVDAPPPVPRAAPYRNPWLLAGLLWLCVAAAAAAGLWHLRREAIDSQSRELGVLSLALTDEISRGLGGVEEGLKALQAELLGGRLRVGEVPDDPQALRSRVNLMPLVNTVWLLDRQGQVVASSGGTPAPPLRAFSPELEGLPAGAVAISRPFGTPLGEPTTQAQVAQVALAVPLQGRTRLGAAHAGGWVLAALPARALLGAFNAALPAADARMAVFRADGALLAGANVPAPTLEEVSVARNLARPPALEQRTFRDGSAHLVGLHTVPRYGLKVLVTRDLAVVLNSWRQAAQMSGVALALLLGVMAAALAVAQHANRRRAEAQRALQAQLARASKLESLGTLAGGVAHDFNNVLAGIVGYGEMARDDAPAASAQARHLDKLLQAALRGRALVERILAFSRGGARVSTVFEFELVIEEVLGLLSASLRPGLVLERALDAPGACLLGDPTQAFEAVMNLCTNALQAMPAGGMLSVQLQRERVAQARVLSHSPLPPGDYLVLSVGDQGPGITPAVMEHLFEPFFTTRGARAGTGLGLAVVHGVVAEFGGAINVASQPGAGARFTLYLPQCHEAPVRGGVAPQPPSPGRGQALLVVDDEPDLVGLAMELLAALGYAPEGSTDAAAALEALRARPTHFAAVLTDEVMPGLSGTQLTQALRSFAPQLPVLLVSAYGGALLARRAAEAGVSRVLAKPLQRAELAHALAELLR